MTTPNSLGASLATCAAGAAAAFAVVSAGLAAYRAGIALRSVPESREAFEAWFLARGHVLGALAGVLAAGTALACAYGIVLAVVVLLGLLPIRWLHWAWSRKRIAAHFGP